MRGYRLEIRGYRRRYKYTYKYRYRYRCTWEVETRQRQMSMQIEGIVQSRCAGREMHRQSQKQRQG